MDMVPTVQELSELTTMVLQMVQICMASKYWDAEAGGPQVWQLLVRIQIRSKLYQCVLTLISYVFYFEKREKDE